MSLQMSNTDNFQRYFHTVNKPNAPSQNITDDINNTIDYDEAEDEDCFSDCSIIISPCSLSSHSSSSSLNSQFSIQDSTSLDFTTATDSKQKSAASQRQQPQKKTLFSLFNTSNNLENSHKNPNASSDSISTVVLSSNLFQDSDELDSGTNIIDDDRTEQQNLSPSFCNSYSFQDNINPSSLADDDSTDELSQVDFSDLDRRGTTNILSVNNSDITTSRSTLSSSAENLFDKLAGISNASDTTPRSSISHSTIISPPQASDNINSSTNNSSQKLCSPGISVDDSNVISRSISRSSSYSSACSTSSNISLKSSMRSASYGNLTLKKRVSFASNDLEDVCFFDKYDTPRSVGSTSDEEEYTEEDDEEGTEDDAAYSRGYKHERSYSNDMFNDYFNTFDILSKNADDESQENCWKMYRRNFSIGNYDKILGNNNIKLEKLSVKNNIMYGHVLVSNLAFEKQVSLKYTTNNWITFNQINLYFKNCKDSNTDRFSFKLNLNSKKFQRLQKQRSSLNFEFCLCYLVNNYKYWDNNNNLNYKLKLYKSENIESGYNSKNSSNVSSNRSNNSSSRIFKNESNVSNINKWWTSSTNKSYDQVISDYCFFKG